MHRFDSCGSRMGDDPNTMKDLRGSMNFEEIIEQLEELKKKMSARSKERAPTGTPDLSNDKSETDESDDENEQDEQEEETARESDLELKPWKVSDEWHIEPPEPPDEMSLGWSAGNLRVDPPSKSPEVNIQNAGISHKDLSNLAQKRVDVSVDVDPPSSGSRVLIGGQEHTIEYDDEGNVQFVKNPTEDDSEPEPDREYRCPGCGTRESGYGVRDEKGEEFCSISCLNETIADG